MWMFYVGQEKEAVSSFFSIDTTLHGYIQVPSALNDELNLPSARKTKRLDELVRHTCNGEFHIKKFVSKASEQFLHVNKHIVEIEK